MTATLTAMAFFAAAQTAFAEAEKCVIKGIALSCGDRTATRADYFRRFSNPQTTDDLVAMLENFPLFENRKQGEAYRRSLERVWRAVTRHGREEKRRYLRGDLTGKTYRKIEGDFEQARKSYEAAINIYRYHIWKPKGSIGRPAEPSG